MQFSAPGIPLISAFRGLGLLLCLSVPGQLWAGFQEDFNPPVGRSLYRTGEWTKFGNGPQAQPSLNKATINSREGRQYVSLVAHGNKTANSRAYHNLKLPVSATQNNMISADMRYASPDSPTDITSNVNVALNANKDGVFDPDGILSMGITSSEGALAFYFIFGGGRERQILSRPEQVTVKPDAWYRFEAKIDPVSGVSTFSVSELNGDEGTQVWSGNNDGFPKYSPEEFVQLNLMVARPGVDELAYRSADFSRIRIGP